jgi:hypothetical protein
MYMIAKLWNCIMHVFTSICGHQMQQTSPVSKGTDHDTANLFLTYDVRLVCDNSIKIVYYLQPNIGFWMYLYGSTVV